MVLLVVCMWALAAHAQSAVAQIEIPPLFLLDDYDKCLSQPAGEYCMGSFSYVADQPDHPLYMLLQNLSSDKRNFNHTSFHRGVCISSHCPVTKDPPSVRFQNCVNNYTLTKYGMGADLWKLDYCKRADQTSSIDDVDLAVAGVFGLLLILNIVGTLYDLLKSGDEKPNKYLVCWSLRANWRRLTATHKDGDPRLNALNPINGVKTLTMSLVILAHVDFLYYSMYMRNPEFLEKVHRIVVSYIFFNGSAIVQTFIMISSFLITYNLMIHREKEPLSIKLFPMCFVFRISRILPLYIAGLGLASTWARFLSDGPLWWMVEREATTCRNNWWTHILFINNIMEEGDHCLIQSWFLAADMQLYIASTLIVLILGRWQKTAIITVVALFISSVGAVFVFSFFGDVKSVMYLMTPEHIRTQLVGERSFRWLYASPWGSAAASLAGVLLGLLQHRIVVGQRRLAASYCFKFCFRLAIPLLITWMLSGYWIVNEESPIVVSLYTALERPVLVGLVGVALLGLIHKVDVFYRSIISLYGHRVLSRVSLAVLLLHWHVALLVLASRRAPVDMSVLAVTGDWLTVCVLSYLAAIPATLVIEQPINRFIRTLIRL